MSMFIDNEKRELYFLIPNSEAPVEAQHKGIADRSVGSFYMSEQYLECFEFLNHFNGEFVIDIALCLKNAKKCFKNIKENHLENAFKNNMIPQISSIDTLEWFLENEKNPFYPINNPCVNENKKYLKLNNNNLIYKLLKSFMLGDLSKLVFKKVGSDGFIIYIDYIENIDEKINGGSLFEWSLL